MATGREALIEALQVSEGATRVAAKRQVNTIIATLKRELSRDGQLTLVGFGRFDVRKTEPRMGRNPATGEAIEVKRGSRVGFRASPALKAAV